MMKNQTKIILKKNVPLSGKYVIKLEGKTVWEGKNPLDKFPLIANKNPGKSLSISWKNDVEFFIV